MRTLTKTIRFSALVLALGGLAVACGDSEGGGDDDNPDLIGDNDDGDGDDQDGSGGDGNDPDGSGGDGNDPDGNGGDGNDPDGSGDGDACPEPTTSIEFLNACAPEGVERRQFDNVARLPSNYDPNGSLPTLP